MRSTLLFSLALSFLLSGCHRSRTQPQVPQTSVEHSSVEQSPVEQASQEPVTKESEGGYCMFSSATGPVDSPLMIAVWRGDLQKAKELIEPKTDLNVTFRESSCEDLETTPLLNAVVAASFLRSATAHEEMVEFLLRAGALPNLTSHGYSPLHAAASQGNLKMVQLLLRYGARPDFKYRGETPLLMAAGRKKAVALIPELIAGGANIDDVDDLGGNAISVAASSHNLEGVRLFVKLGVDACAGDRKGRTALYWAKSNLDEDPDKQEIISFLQQKCGG
jgi:ankyrin repeat protein